MRPDLSATAQLLRPEEAKIVRQAVVERLVASGANRRAARRLAEDSYRRVADGVEAELKMNAVGRIVHGKG